MKNRIDTIKNEQGMGFSARGIEVINAFLSFYQDLVGRRGDARPI